MEVKQVDAELAQMRELYIETRPQRVLEIGCWDGGTLREWLLHAPPDATIVAVDLNHRNQDAYEEWQRSDTALHLITGDSQRAKTIAAIKSRGPFDWAFIDADHDEGPVRSDVNVCRSVVRPGGLLLLHDVVPGAGLPVPGPGIVLAELRRKGCKVREIIEDPGEWPWAHGVGIVQL